jgi:hypothetical protein
MIFGAVAALKQLGIDTGLIESTLMSFIVALRSPSDSPLGSPSDLEERSKRKRFWSVWKGSWKTVKTGYFPKFFEQTTS